MMTAEQKGVYDNIMQSVLSDSGGFYFLYRYGGTGKTFVWNTLSAAIRSMGMIVLNVASSGIASLLLPGGRTTHSRFCIPLQTDETTTYNIKQGSLRANLLICAKLIIWDETPMLNKNCFEALDRTLRDMMRQEDESNMDKPFGGKVVVLGGDLRQILPVIPKGGRQDIVSATVHQSLQQKLKNLLTEFSKLEMVILNQMRVNMKIEKFLEERCILCPTLECVEKVNYFMLDLLPGIPNHKIILKEGAPIMLLRNIDQAASLCIGTRLIVADLGTNVIKVTAITGTNIGEDIFIPRMDMVPSVSGEYKLIAGLNCTKVMFNPDIPQAVSYRERKFPIWLKNVWGYGSGTASLYLSHPWMHHLAQFNIIPNVVE
ncbi:uncharacterized protein LOC130724871 [Lotus japonicus]|uniref:uncharacterized protein LOC130724871 n=1 Tax=Lotus japonicus TaxID=34305 RepID=UPI00258712BA|nr:uncharacterized protein LOC130724871 [Lotus japonicus]